MKTIKILVETNGEIKITTQGFAGSQCKDATKAIEQALGKTVSDTATQEMYETERLKITC